jgi:hypothetical protein
MERTVFGDRDRVTHTVRVSSAEATVLLLFAPAGFEGLFPDRAAFTAAGIHRTVEVLIALTARYRSEHVCADAYLHEKDT